MPELPEVEVICRGIRPFLLNRTIREIHHSGKKLRRDVPVTALNEELINSRVAAVERRAKYLLIRFDTSALLIFHFGMTGNLGIFSPHSPTAKHDHLRLRLDNETELRFNDTRRFGSISLIRPGEQGTVERDFFKNSGPEPFTDKFSGKYLQQLAKGKQQPVKVFIMTSRTVAGIGNIYASESLFAAGIRPSRKIKQISLQSWNRLAAEIRKVLKEAISCGGSTISDFVNASQEKGYFQMNFKVYGRSGESCLKCSSSIKKQTIGGRASYYCPKCQK
ncbi:MAG: bifunctional DNA-formamidopyrimidine glycosylase/DNA-(apurinic or apyrimidinic site) lyase [Deltaproteobacteria bacterium]|nr:bifunctional DNA-formamidopyrimidine glycosylase/DNA-(apurinic or apyrimidinic site) lyase [Deltaproteobacteria bacterium]